MPIKGLSEQVRMTRLGKIHLGIKVEKKGDKGEVISTYPHATEYFVVPTEVEKVYGPQPKELTVIIPVEDETIWASQWYKRYSFTRGLVCKGDGETCWRMIDINTGAMAGRETKEVAWEKDLPCEGRECPEYKDKNCKEVMCLQFLLPEVPGLGVWQIDTGSINSIKNINDFTNMIRQLPTRRINWIPLVLTLEPAEVVNPDDGKKKRVHVLNLRIKQTLLQLMAASSKPVEKLLAPPPPDEEEEPLDVIDEDTVEAIDSPGTADEEFDNLPRASEPYTTIDLVWLNDTMRRVKWTEDTARTWISSNIKNVDTQGKLSEVLGRMTKDQTEKFCKELQDRAAKVQPELFP